MGERVPRLSSTFRRSLREQGVQAGSSNFRAVFKTVAALARTSDLPGPLDVEVRFRPGRAYVRRVSGENLWVFYRFDLQHLYVMTARNVPPTPAEA